MDPQSIYREAAGKQRIVITGAQASVITAMIAYTLAAFHRQFDLVRDGKVNGSQAIKDSEAPVVIVEDGRIPYSSLTGYQHHIVVISETDESDECRRNIITLAEATPKAGIIIYDEKGSTGAIGKVPRADVTAVPYSAYQTREENGKMFVITSTNDRFPIKISGGQNLRSLSAAKEVLKKTGITSGQFYEAMTSFEL